MIISKLGPFIGGNYVSIRINVSSERLLESRSNQVIDCQATNFGGDMLYRMMGNTGLQVSVLSYGFWATFGVKDRLSNDAGIQAAKELLHQARMAGVNLFDNAEVYANASRV